MRMHLALGFALLAVGCSEGGEDLGAKRSALGDDRTVARVPNPPLASDRTNLAGDLRGAPVPQLASPATYVKNAEAAIRLGKALFWDMQVGGDGVQACASCHFRAGADPRSKNQVSPGLRRFPEADRSFTTGGPNHQLTEASFPLTRLAVPPGSPGFASGQRGALDPATDSNDAVSSQGVHFLGEGPDPDGFNVSGLKTRRVAPRNAPSVINAVYNHRQFWDGHAENVFNGVNHLGERDPNARVARAPSKTAIPELVKIGIPNASLASQAVAPIISDLEQAAPGTSVVDVLRQLRKSGGKRAKALRDKRPLEGQRVSPTDSVLGPLADTTRTGLNKATYDAMIHDAFQNVWWESDQSARVTEDGTVTFFNGKPKKTPPAGTEELTLTEYNFALFFGIAVQMYEATLVSDDTPWDRFRREHPSPTDPALNPWTNTDPGHITRFALFGASLFNDRTRGPTNIRCSNCHESTEMTDASVRRIAAATNGPVRNRDGNIIDKGFSNIGIRPTADDLGTGESDVFGPLSLSKRRFPNGAPVGQMFDGTMVSKGFGVEGGFKIPSLRNVALTAPYFHNGDARTLREAVALYSRGGNVFPVAQTDGTPIEPLGLPNLADEEIDAIVAFLETLTDERVYYARAPFDHPQLFVPNGHVGDSTQTSGSSGKATDIVYEVPAVGAAGGAPLPGFLEGPFR